MSRRYKKKKNAQNLNYVAEMQNRRRFITVDENFH